MANDDLYNKLERETEKLERYRKEENSLRSKYEALRHLRDCQEEEVAYLFRRLIDKVRAE